MVSVTKHIPFEELKGLVRKEKDKHVHERLLFIHQLYLGDSVEEACERMCLSNQTGYNWLEQWNSGGYEGLAPDFGGGRPPKLTKYQKERLKDKLRSGGNWLTSQARALIRRDFGITYSIRHVARILRGFGMHYAKPCPRDYRCPVNAEELLARSICGAMDSTPSDSIIGFMERSTSKHVCEFLQKIRGSNPGKHIIVLVDNFSSHIAKVTRRYAVSIGITLVFLPPYSPHLNPIELIWKSVRRRVSQVFINSEWSLKETIRTTFHMLAKKPSFMKNWLDTFMPEFSK